MRIILIGASGKIGELVQKALAGAGHEIVKVNELGAGRAQPCRSLVVAMDQRPNGMPLLDQCIDRAFSGAAGGPSDQELSSRLRLHGDALQLAARAQ